MRVAAIITLLYASCLLDGGIIGYVKAKSLPSLLSGVLTGVVGAAAAVLIWRHQTAGQCLAGCLALLLGAFGGKSWLADRKPFMPRGAIFVLSVAELAVLLLLRH